MDDKGPYCYVGDYAAAPTGCITMSYEIHPRDFHKWVNGLGQDARVWTNNPYLADCFPAENVYCCRVGNNDDSYRRCLASHPEWRRWRVEMWPGEFWSVVGDDWVLKEQIIEECEHGN